MKSNAFLPLALAVLLICATREACGKDVPVREIHVRVLGLNGKPAPGRAVQLWGVSRYSMREEEKIEPDWNFVTDEAGRCVVRLSEHALLEENPIPGWGTYALRVTAGPRDAGAFSPFLIHEETRWMQRYEMQNRKVLEWGPPLVVAGRKMNLTLQIEPGFTIRGQVMRYAGGGPWADVAVSSSYNLYAESHTGFGAELNGPSTKTDAHGRYVLRHVYPSKLHLGISENWVRTKRDDRPWITDRLDQIAPAPRQSTVSLQIAAATGKPFRVFGRVQDTARQPIAGATVTVGFASHREPYEWHEEHFENVTTDAAGNYEFSLESPWLMEVSVKTDGHADAIHPGSDDYTARLRPGRHDFTLK